MKLLRRVFIIFSLFMLVILYVFLNIDKRYDYSKRDIVYYNDQLHMIEESYLNGLPKEELEERFDCSIIMSKEINDPELSQIYASNGFVLDFEPGGEYIGKVAWLDNMDRYNQEKEDFAHSALVMWVIVYIGFIVFIIYLHRSLVKPVNELVGFSEEMAKGNLDEALPIHKDNLFGSFVEAFDIMREELKAARIREIEAERARKELITQLSHDIKTPLSIIKATCEVLEIKFGRRLKENDKAATDKNDISKEQDELRDAIDKIGVISKKTDTVSALMTNVMHATLDELEHIEVNVCEENSAVVEELITGLKNYGNIIIKGHIPPCLVYMDKLRMEQVIDNIIGNSYKYAGTDIEVSFDKSEEILMDDGSKGVFIKTVISDNGPGVNEEDLPLLAEKYYRGRNSAEQNGYGLGMYLVKLYMDKQGGGMEYYNNNGFTVELLLRKV
ncbi:MAG: HAMP domain-containing histidine kinase [Lachnospiraceae bacterium]|nr:HAMP domain-containing histidine kinase [Lachnospiraceae bacterium]